MTRIEDVSAARIAALEEQGMSHSDAASVAMAEDRGAFHTPYDEYREREGQTFTLLGEVDRSTFDYDECGSLYRIRFDDGNEIDAWPEEIESVLGPQRTDQ